MNKTRRNAGLRDMASQLKRKGQRGDSVLAHINPQEAHYLQHTQGGDINPHTGLPQFGLFGKKGFIGQMVRHPKKLLPVAGAILGNMAMPGIGGSMLGGGIGGALSSKKHPLDHALGGALLGGAGSLAFGGGELPSFLTGAGAKTAGALGGAKHLGMIGGGREKEIIQDLGKEGAEGSWMDKIGRLMADNPLETGLGATAIIGTLLSKPKKQRGESGHPEGSLADMIATNQRLEAAHNPPGRNVKPMNRKKIPYTSEQWFSKPGSLPYFEDINPPTEYYAEGGHVGVGHYDPYSYAHGGYIDGDSGGQDDDIQIEMNPGSYVMDATTISLLGDGNSKRGDKELKSWEDKAMSSGIVNSRDYGDSHRVKALVSPGERVMSEKFVTSVGKGNNERGAKMLDKFRNRVRAHKGVKKFLPPKSKPITSYLKER